jgi:hypothetical protein
MKLRKISIAAGAIIFMLIMVRGATATPDQMEYTDEEGDLLVLSDPTGHEDDVDMVSMSVDQSSRPVVVKITVKGQIKANYGAEQSNNIQFILDLDGDFSQGEVQVTMDGSEEGDEGFMTLMTNEAFVPLTEGDYTLSGSTLTVNIPISYVGAGDEVQDFAASTVQGFPGTSIMDTVNWEFGEDDAAYGEGSSDDDTADDDITDDDTSDDDAADDDTSDDDDDDDSPGFTLLLSLASVMAAAVLLGRFRKKET